VNGIALLLLGSATVGVVHSILPDHWVPLAVVARTHGWSILRLARVSFLAACGHVLTSIVLGGIVALVGLQFQRQVETQQGHIVGAVLIATGAGFLVWGLTGHGHVHDHGTETHREEAHDHAHESGVALAAEHVHEHAHHGVRHSHRHSHEAFIQARASLIVDRSNRGTLLGHLGAIAVPFGVAASPDLTFLPFAFAASAYGKGAVAAVLGSFSIVTLGAFVGLTVAATAVGYQMRGEWLEKNANTITSLVLMVVGVVAYVGL
jgi:nickel/cobalt exporter